MRKIYFAIPLATLAIAIGLAFQVDGLNWRFRVIGNKLTGKIDDLSWGEVVGWLRPGSPVYLGGLAEEPNTFMSISNSFSSSGDLAAGSDIYASHCSTCHGASGDGASGPSLLQQEGGASDWALFRTIQRGRPEKAMPPSGLDEREIWQVIGHLRALANAHNNGPASERAGPDVSAVTSTRLLNSSAEPQNWILQNGDYSSHRFSQLKQISRDNVDRLALKWAYQMSTSELVETIPLVNDGIMYLTEPRNAVIAVDAATGREIWRYQHAVRGDTVYAYGVMNRGVALTDQAVYLATLDAQVIALDARTGKVLWRAQAGDPTIGRNFTSAPLAIDGKILVGISGGDHGLNGFVDAYDAKTGEHLWRFDTVPSAGEPGYESWGSANAAEHGGAVPWGIGSYDPELDLVYWGIGNPAPDFNGDVRPGDNLYANSVVALDPDTGEMRWYFQFTPHGTHDWDSVQVPVLVDAEWQGMTRKLMLWANRNAFYYVLDRQTGEFLTATAYAKQTWAEGIDSSGKPIVRPDAEPTPEGTLVWPSAMGATNWWPPAYSPEAALFYIPTLEQPGLFFKGEPTFETGVIYLGTNTKPPSAIDFQHTPSIRALDLAGNIRWKHEFPARGGWSRVGGVLATAGDLIFAGDFQTFYALDADNGNTLWSVETGGGINAAPVTYAVRDRQFVTIAAGNALFAFALAPEPRTN